VVHRSTVALAVALLRVVFASLFNLLVDDGLVNGFLDHRGDVLFVVVACVFLDDGLVLMRLVDAVVVHIPMGCVVRGMVVVTVRGGVQCVRDVAEEFAHEGSAYQERRKKSPTSLSFIALSHNFFK